MPSTVYGLLSSAGLSLNGQARWGEKIDENRAGVYIISLSSNPETMLDSLGEAPIDNGLLTYWITTVATIKLDRARPTENDLAKRMSKFWLPDETILYIGKAGSSLRDRVHAYYRTKLGERRPHSGGHWIKTLSLLSNLTVYWAVTEKPEQVEGMLLREFIRNVSESSRLSLFDRERPFPFANLEYPKGIRKRHRITGARLG